MLQVIKKWHLNLFVIKKQLKIKGWLSEFRSQIEVIEHA